MSDQREVWLPIPEYEGLYEVSDLGRVRSFKKLGPQILKGGPSTCSMKYVRVTLRSADHVASVRYVHTLVLEVFRGPRPAGMFGLHNDGNVSNCKLANLRWGTPAENTQDRIRHGRLFNGASNPNGRLSAAQVSKIRSEYHSGRAKQTALAAAYGVSQAHISRIILKHSWS
jgi:hypothetical protein